MVLFPNSFDNFPIFAMELTGAFHHIIIKCANKILIVGQHESSFSLLEIFNKFT